MQVGESVAAGLARWDLGGSTEDRVDRDITDIRGEVWAGGGAGGGGGGAAGQVRARGGVAGVGDLLRRLVLRRGQRWGEEAYEDGGAAFWRGQGSVGHCWGCLKLKLELVVVVVVLLKSGGGWVAMAGELLYFED